MRAVVVIPTYNEAATLRRVVESVRATGRAHALVVDDASPDGTGALADWLAERDYGVHVLHRERKDGLGAAYRAGMTWALASGYDAIGQMDADASHDPADVPRLLDSLHNADLVIGSRYVPGGGVRNWPRSRQLLSRGGNAYVRLWTGLPVADATAGFRVFRRQTLAALDVDDLRSDGYSFQIELALRTYASGFRVVEIPITFMERTDGESKMSRSIVAEALWRVPRWAIGWRRGPVALDDRSVAAAPRDQTVSPGPA
ncbi:MAG: polyprenol monophosphomannose synthase [Actinobacteria bacterium]|nr:polyprenol monophosphomannose synthase [Actinomycetota bacterium]